MRVGFAMRDVQLEGPLPCDLPHSQPPPPLPVTDACVPLESLRTGRGSRK